MKYLLESDTAYAIKNVLAIKSQKNFFKVSEWATKKRNLPPELSNKSGPWRNDVTPYLVEIMDCFSEHSFIKDVAFMKGAQIGATTGILENVIGYIIDHMPGPTLYVNADKDMAELGIELRIDRMISSAGLADKIYSQSEGNDKFRHKTGSTKSKKEFKGGFILARGANSPGKLRMFSVRFLLMDEIDGFPVSAGKEGDPVALAEARTKGYIDVRKRLYNSTPLIKHTSKIYKKYMSGDQRKFFVPCKDCGHFQVLTFDKNKEGRGGITFDRDDNGNLIEDSVGYVCVECGVIWKNVDKIHFLKKGEWRPTAISSNPVLRSYHLNALYSPIGMYSWMEAVRDFLGTLNDVQKYKTFVNTVLGEPWVEHGERPKYRNIMSRRISYLKGTVHPDVQFLTMACDIHKGRIDVEILGWAKDQVTYSVDWISIEEDTMSTDGKAWKTLEKMIMNGVGGFPISLTLVDSGFLTDQVYRFCARFGTGVYPCKGMPKYDGKKSLKLVDVDGYGDLKCVQIWVDFYKDRLSGWLKKEAVEKGDHHWGTCFYPSDYPDSYFKQYASEHRLEVVDSKGEVLRYTWKKRSSTAPNHAWDDRVYNMAAFDFFLELIRIHNETQFTIEEFYEFLAKKDS